jgi:uncharacterized protein YebE (UPF0316 family)
VIVRVITNKDAADLVQYLRGLNYGVTAIDAAGSGGPVKILFMVIKRLDLRQVVSSINLFQPSAFYSVEDVKSVAEGVFPEKRSRFYRKDK